MLCRDVLNMPAVQYLVHCMHSRYRLGSRQGSANYVVRASLGMKKGLVLQLPVYQAS